MNRWGTVIAGLLMMLCMTAGCEDEVAQPVGSGNGSAWDGYAVHEGDNSVDPIAVAVNAQGDVVFTGGGGWWEHIRPGRAEQNVFSLGFVPKALIAGHTSFATMTRQDVRGHDPDGTIRWTRSIVEEADTPVSMAEDGDGGLLLAHRLYGQTGYDILLQRWTIDGETSWTLALTFDILVSAIHLVHTGDRIGVLVTTNNQTAYRLAWVDPGGELIDQVAVESPCESGTSLHVCGVPVSALILTGNTVGEGRLNNTVWMARVEHDGSLGWTTEYVPDSDYADVAGVVCGPDGDVYTLQGEDPASDGIRYVSVVQWRAGVVRGKESYAVGQSFALPVDLAPGPGHLYFLYEVFPSDRPEVAAIVDRIAW